MDSPPAADAAPPGFPYGPYYRLESETQTPQHAAQQERSGELWGQHAVKSPFLTANANCGKLPEGQRGVEFWAQARESNYRPDGPSIPFARWGRFGRLDPDEVDDRDGFAIIRINVTRNTER